MSLRQWAVKPGELRALSRSGVMLFSARCAIRMEPWLPSSATKVFAKELLFLVDAAFGEPVAVGVLRKRAGALSDLGASACNKLAKTDEPLGICMNYATSTLVTALEAATSDDRKDAVKVALVCAKLSASIPAVWAHAGRVRAPAGVDPVDLACDAVWDAIRADIEPVAAHTADIEHAKDRVKALRAVAPSWRGRAPRWTKP